MSHNECAFCNNTITNETDTNYHGLPCTWHDTVVCNMKSSDAVLSEFS